MAKRSRNPLNNMSDRTLEVVTIIIVIMTVLLGMTYVAIGVNPYIILNPFPPGARDASETSPDNILAAVEGTPTFPPTWTPTATLTATPTLTPSATWTATATGTATATRTPSPTGTSIPPTSTPMPARTSQPLPPAPSTPPPSHPYEYERLLVGPNCHWFGFHGIIRGANGLPMSGVPIKVWNEAGFSTMSAPSNGDGIYQVPITGEQATGLWWLQIWENDAPASEQLGVEMGGGCQYGIQEVKMDWHRRL